MKKILLLFVLFLGLNVGAFALSEVESMDSLPLDELPAKAVIYYQDGTTAKVDDGWDCTTVYGESDTGMVDQVWTNCK